MRKLVEGLGLVLLVCLGVRIGAMIIEPVLPMLGSLVVVGALGLWLMGRRGAGGGYR
ncbi:MAG: hypothetical protein U5R31_13210 [Acidimicrobiia bacterium]|nr:hypothetical protein [Acidimicrobiia bacterium]